jgi:hypothetical protein
MLPVSKQFVAFRLLEVSEDSVSCVLIACKIKNQAGFWPRLSPEIIIIPPYQKLDGTQPGKPFGEQTTNRQLILPIRRI